MACLPVADFFGSQTGFTPRTSGFSGERAAYLAQKSISEYAQARAHMVSSTLLSERAFQDAYERARWFSFPATLSMVAEALAARLRNLDISDTDSINVMLQALAEDIVSAYPVPAGGSQDFWQMALLDLERDFENLPVHPSDFDMFQNTLSFHLTEIGAEIEEGLSVDSARKILAP